MKSPSPPAAAACRAACWPSCSTPRLPALADNVVVGTATLDLEHKATGRKVTSELWFKAAADAKIEWFSPRLPLRPIPIARNADPQPPPRKHPLIVVSHGNWGTSFSQGWLALELVKAGYVVLSTSHPGTIGDDQTVAGRYRLWDRSRDVSFALDEVLKHPKWAALIDADRIGFVGHSFGGWTGVSLAGGRYDPARQRAFCQKPRTKGLLLRGHAQGRYRRRIRRRTPETRSGTTASRRSTSWVPAPDRVLPPTRSVDQRPVRGGHRPIRREPGAAGEFDQSRPANSRRKRDRAPHRTLRLRARMPLAGRPDPHAPGAPSAVRRSQGRRSRRRARPGRTRRRRILRSRAGTAGVAEVIQVLGRNWGPDRFCWCRRRELNPRPTHYECVALPLSYCGFQAA